MNTLFISGIIFTLFSFQLFGDGLPQDPFLYPTDTILFPSPPTEAFLNTSQLITHYGYTHESHSVTTEDGYILKLFRIPRGCKNQTGLGPVIVQHGIFSSSDDWFALQKADILPFLLADQGYDVWLGNSRGNVYSRQHVIHTYTDLKFWDFSHDEMGMYDIPAAIKYILNVTGSDQLSYIGHSLGANMFFIAMDTHPYLQHMVKRMIAMAPAVYATHVRSPLRFLADFRSEAVLNYADLHFGGQALPKKFLNAFNAQAPYVCIGRKGSTLCKSALFLVAGFNQRHTTPRTVSIVFGHYPSGTSAKTVVQFLQYVKTPRFQRFDYGKHLNLKRYGSEQPPLYNLTAVNVPMMVTYSDNDWVVVPADAQRVIRELGNVVRAVRMEDPLFNHFDYVFSDYAKRLVYEQCIDFLNS